MDALEYNRFIFNNPVFGVAFDVLEAESEHLIVHVDDQTFNVAGRDESPFFGIYSDVPFQQFEIRNHGSNLEFYQIESISFVVPEPTSFFLLACISILSCCIRHREIAR